MNFKFWKKKESVKEEKKEIDKYVPDLLCF